MRLFRVLGWLLLLTVPAATQTSSSMPASSSPTNGQPGQTSANPLQEAPKEQTQQQAPANQSGTPSNFDLGVGGTAAQDQSLGEVRMMTRYSQIGGQPDGRARSFYTEGSNNLAEFNYFLDRNLLNTGRRFQVLSMVRGTDDRSIDPEHNSVQKAYLRIYGPRDEYIVGDALVSYSRLTFNQNIKGVSTAWKLGSRWKLSSVAGVFIDRYGSLFKDQPAACFDPSALSTSPQCGRPFAAAAEGVRLEYAFTPNSALGFNFSSSDDLSFTRRERPFNEAPMPATNRVGSLDLKWQRGTLRTDAEFAYSATNFDSRPGDCIEPCDPRLPTPGLGVQGDWGARFEASYRWRSITFRGSYVRFQPAFASMNARQLADLQDFLFRISYDLTSWLTLDGTMRRSNDSLKNQKPYELVMWGPEGRLIFHDLPFFRRGSFELGYRHRIVNGSSDVLPADVLPEDVMPAGCALKDSGSGMVCVDRYVRTPYVEFSIPLSTTFLTLGYERRQSVDLLTPAATSNTNRVYASVRGMYGWGGWHVSPELRYEIERQSSRPGLYNVYPGWEPSAADLFLLRESNRLATTALYVETPRWFSVKLAFRDNSATTLSGYSRPSYNAAVTYKLANDENKVFVFSFERNNNFYFSEMYPPGGQLNPINFDERIAGVTFVYRFGKRGR